MGTIDEAESFEELGEAVKAIAGASFDSYQKVSLSCFETLTGAKPFDAEASVKDMQLWAGTMAKDLGAMTVMWQKAVQILTPPPES